MADNEQNRQHPVVKDILEQVSSGGLKTSAALHGLHDILLRRNPSAGGSSAETGSNMFSDYEEEMGTGNFDGNRGGESYNDVNFTSTSNSNYSNINNLNNNNNTSGDNDNYDDNDNNDGDDINSRFGSASQVIEQSIFPSSSGGEMLSDTRSQRIAHQESLIRQEVFRECTFRPSIKALPSYYGSQKDQDTPFLQRVSKWQKDKEVDANKRKTNSTEHELEGCTFRPKINTLSIRSVKMTRGETKESANIRLFKSADITALTKQKLLEEELRLEKEKEMCECTFKPNVVTKGKFKDVGTRFDRAVAKPPVATTNTIPDTERKECTFTPKVKGVASNMSSAKLYVSTNVVDRLSRPPSAPNTPLRTTTRYSRDDMDMNQSSSHQRGRAGSRKEDDSSSTNNRPVMDVASFMGSLTAVATNNNNNADDASINNENISSFDAFFDQSAKPNTEVRSLNTAAGRDSSSSSSQFETPNKNRARPKSAPRERTDNKGERGGENSEKNDGSTLDEKKFSDFIDRQTQYLKKRDQHVKDAEQKATPGFKPKLESKDHNFFFHTATDSSIHQAKENISLQGEFLDRVERDVLRRNEKEKTKSQQALTQHTFKPQVITSKKTEALPRRSYYEMSKQDALKKDSNHRMIKLQLDKERMVDATFKPEITTLAKKTNSKLSLKDDPSKFLDVYKEQQTKIEEKMQEELNRRAQKEMEDCTFAPQTVECPEYIKRIAKSMSVVRKARVNHSINSGAEKTDWR